MTKKNALHLQQVTLGCKGYIVELLTFKHKDDLAQ